VMALGTARLSGSWASHQLQTHPAGAISQGSLDKAGRHPPKPSRK